jgi:hypothetical protein
MSQRQQHWRQVKQLQQQCTAYRQPYQPQQQQQHSPPQPHLMCPPTARASTLNLFSASSPRTRDSATLSSPWPTVVPHVAPSPASTLTRTASRSNCTAYAPTSNTDISVAPLAYCNKAFFLHFLTIFSPHHYFSVSGFSLCR